MLKTSVFAILVLIPFSLALPKVNEVMPNPLNESNEWVEIFSAVPINISEWRIGDDNSNDSIVCIDCIVSGYFLIIGNSASISSINSSAIYFVTDDSKIGNGLSNSADCIRFFNGSYSSSFCWNSTVEESSWTLLSNGSWVICQNDTPGGLNSCEPVQIPLSEPQPTQNEIHIQNPVQQEAQAQQAGENIALKARLTSDVYAGTTYENLFKVVIKNKKNCSEKDSVKTDFNISGGGIIYTSSWEREVGCSGYDGTGFWMPEVPGRYVICGIIRETTAGDSDKSDNSLCWGINVLQNTSYQSVQKSREPLREENLVQKPQEYSNSLNDSNNQQPVISAAENNVSTPDSVNKKENSSLVDSFKQTFLAIVKILYNIGLLIR